MKKFRLILLAMLRLALAWLPFGRRRRDAGVATETPLMDESVAPVGPRRVESLQPSRLNGAEPDRRPTEKDTSRHEKAGRQTPAERVGPRVVSNGANSARATVDRSDNSGTPGKGSFERTPYMQAVTLLQEETADLSESVTLSRLSLAIRGEIRGSGGSELNNWFGYGKFKPFLEQALPNSRFSEDGHSLLPGRERTDDHIPPVIRILLTSRKVLFPTFEMDEWQVCFRGISAVVAADLAAGRRVDRRPYRRVNAWVQENGYSLDSKSLMLVLGQIHPKRRELKTGSKLEVENLYLSRIRPLLEEKTDLPNIEVEHAEAWIRGYATRSRYLRRGNGSSRRTRSPKRRK